MTNAVEDAGILSPVTIPHYGSHTWFGNPATVPLPMTVSEMSWSQHLRSAQDFMKVGDEVEAVILTLDHEEATQEKIITLATGGQ